MGKYYIRLCFATAKMIKSEHLKGELTMNNELLSNPELQRVALACLDYGSPVVCFSWVARRYAARFGGTFHQARLAELERLRILAKDGDTSRGGHRRYWRIVDPVGLAELLKCPTTNSN